MDATAGQTWADPDEFREWLADMETAGVSADVARRRDRAIAEVYEGLHPVLLALEEFTNDLEDALSQRKVELEPRIASVRRALDRYIEGALNALRLIDP